MHAAAHAHANAQARAYVIRFESLFDGGRALAFPCDAEGHVVVDHMSEAARRNFERAQALVGREFATPDVRPADWC